MTDTIDFLLAKCERQAGELARLYRTLWDRLGLDGDPTDEVVLGEVTAAELIPGDRFIWHGRACTVISRPKRYFKGGTDTGAVALRVAELVGRIYLPADEVQHLLSAAPLPGDMEAAQAAYEMEGQ